MAIQKLVVRHSLVAGKDFTGEDPAQGPKLDGIIYSYLGRNKGGLIKFSSRALMRLERVLLRFQDASAWSIGILHTQSKYEGENSKGTKTILADETSSNTSDDGTSILINPEEVLIDGDHLIVETTGASAPVFVEAIALPLKV